MFSLLDRRFGSPRSEKKKNTRLLALSFGLSLAAGLVYCGQHNGGAEIPKEDNNSHIETCITVLLLTKSQ